MFLQFLVDKILKQCYSATPKMHKFIDIKLIVINDLKLRPIIDQTGTQLYARAYQEGSEKGVTSSHFFEFSWYFEKCASNFSRPVLLVNLEYFIIRNEMQNYFIYKIICLV